jgi:hypothetical protein
MRHSISIILLNISVILLGISLIRVIHDVSVLQQMIEVYQVSIH